MSADMENRCPPTKKTVVHPHGAHLSAYKEFSLSLDTGFVRQTELIAKVTRRKPIVSFSGRRA